MKKIDNVVLVLFQKLADVLQQWFGRNTFFWAKLMLIVSVTCSVGKFQNNIITHAKMPIQEYIFPPVFWVVSIWVWIFCITPEEVCTRKNLAIKNFNIEGLRWVRYILIGALMYSVLKFFIYVPKIVGYQGDVLYRYLCDQIMKVTFFISMYFASCTPQTPSKSKVKVLIKSIVGAVTSTKRIAVI